MGTGETLDISRAKYTDVEAVVAAKTVKLDDLAAPDDNTDLDATSAKHGLMAKAEQAKLDGIDAGADVTGANAPQAHASAHEPGGSDQVHSIADDDDDTKIQVEESADEDIVRMDVAGVESFHLSTAGMLTMVKQPAAFVYLDGDATAQLIPNNTWTHVLLDTEKFDVQNEFDSSVVSGTADATGANKLHDADGGFTAGLVGATVWNTTDTTYTTVSGFVDSGELDLTDDIMADTETYKIYFSRFTATEAGKYVVNANIGIQVIDAQRGQMRINVNGTPKQRVAIPGSFTTWVYCMGGGIYNLSASDYITLTATHAIGGNGYIYGDEWATFLSVVKVS